VASGSRVDKIQDVLRNLRAVSPDIVGSAVVSVDGFIIASLLPNDIDEELVSGMAAALLGVGERIELSSLKRGESPQHTPGDAGIAP
jgi:predicted regulator of Ras-like GTPase activity (Roadblock/LC7/MglB family)